MRAPAAWIVAATWLAAGCGDPARKTSVTHTRVATTNAPAAYRPPPPTGPPHLRWNVGEGLKEAASMVALVNEFRRVAGVHPTALDPALTRGCREHARYMVINRGKPQLHSINAHRQDPSLPGATPEGAACGRAAVLYKSIGDLRTAVHGWMATLYHRAPIIAPYMTRVGVGAHPLPTRIRRVAVALRFVAGVTHPEMWPVVYPADGQRQVPVHFQSENPDPIPIRSPSRSPGYPITLQFSPLDSVTSVSATLTDGAGKAVPFHLSSPEKPASKYNPQRGLIGVIPVHQLRSGTTYKATITATWKGKVETTTTTFTTMKRVEVDSTDEEALLAALGKPARVRGVVKWARLGSGSVNIKLVGPPLGGRILTVSLFVPKSAFVAAGGKLGKNRYIEGLVGRTVEVDASPKHMFRTVRFEMAPRARFHIRPR